MKYVTIRPKRMRDATKADYDAAFERQQPFLAAHPERILETLRRASGHGGLLSELDHSLQSATRAMRDGKDSEYVVACLLHDIGNAWTPYNHGEAAALLIRPYVSEEMTWVIQHHPVFQYKYYGEHVGIDPDSREIYRGHQWFDATVEFVEYYDENCVDPDYESLPLDEFAPLIRELFAKPPSSDHRRRADIDSE